MTRSLKIFALGLAAATALASSASAGGFSRGTADTDILYEDGNFNMRAGVTIVMPTHKYSANANPALVGTSPLDDYIIPSFAAKLNVTDSLACAGTLTDAYGGSATYAAPLVSGKTSEKFTVTELGLTCGYNFDVGPGFLTILGGGFYEFFDYELTTALGTLTTLSGGDVGYRIGAAYSIPEIALRAQLMYRSGTQHNPDGNTTIPALGPASPVFNATGAGELPQSVELKLQSGIAPGWLAFGSVKWTDWSVLDTLDLNAGAFASQNLYYYKDGWTVSAGIGHQIAENATVFGALQWDQGVGTGYDLNSTKWTAAAGGAITDQWGGQLSGSVAYTYIASAAETQYGALNAAADTGHAVALSASYKVKF